MPGCGCSPADGPRFSLAGVQSALYGLALSLLICVAAVAVFTTHVLLLLPVLLSILGKWARVSLAGSSFSPPLTLISSVKVSRHTHTHTPPTAGKKSLCDSCS